MEKEITLEEFVGCAEVLLNSTKIKRYNSFEFNTTNIDIMRKALEIMYNNPQCGFDMASVAFYMIKENESITDTKIAKILSTSAASVNKNIKAVLRNLNNIINVLNREGDLPPISLLYFCYKYLPTAVYNPILRGTCNCETISLEEFLDFYTYEDLTKFSNVGSGKLKIFVETLEKNGYHLKHSRK
jgi:hypothetical protein